MTTLSVRLPDSVHRNARLYAEREGTSLNQLVATAVAEKLAALGAEEYTGSAPSQPTTTLSRPRWRPCRMCRRARGIDPNFEKTGIASMGPDPQYSPAAVSSVHLSATQ